MAGPDWELKVMTMVPILRRRVATSIVAVVTAVVAVGCGGNGASEVATGSPGREQAATEVDDPSAPSPTSVVEDDGLSSVQELSAALAATPAWATVRRALPTTAGELTAAAEGVVIGRLEHADDVTIEEVSTEDAVGAVEGVDPLPLDRVSVELTLTVERVSGPVAAAVGPAERVQVPLTVWLSGTLGPEIDAVAGETAAPVRDVAPLGTRLAVFTTGARDRGDGSIVLEVLTIGGLTDPASVVFEVEPAGLVSLDWLIGDEAESYFGAESLDDLTAA
jgi:hypothetical protein